MVAFERAVVSNACWRLIFMIAVLCNHILGEQQCGKILSRGRKLNGKVVGGYEVGFYKYPWFAAMQVNSQSICGGALIAPNVVLTAAHCFDPFRARNETLEDAYTVVLGIYSQCKRESTQTSYNTIKVQLHDMYNNNRPYYDIALLTLDGDTSEYEPICLPSKPLEDSEQAEEAWVAGFGRTAVGSGYPCEMHEGRVLIYDNATCKEMVNDHCNTDKERAYINTLCAGYKTGGADSCAGDSGGSLMTINPGTNTWQTIGITSFGWGCGEKNSMGVYTDVSKYLDWIEEKTGINVISRTEPELEASSPIAVVINSGLDRWINGLQYLKDVVITFANKF